MQSKLHIQDNASMIITIIMIATILVISIELKCDARGARGRAAPRGPVPGGP